MKIPKRGNPFNWSIFSTFYILVEGIIENGRLSKTALGFTDLNLLEPTLHIVIIVCVYACLSFVVNHRIRQFLAMMGDKKRFLTACIYQIFLIFISIFIVIVLIPSSINTHQDKNIQEENDNISVVRAQRESKALKAPLTSIINTANIFEDENNYGSVCGADLSQCSNIIAENKKNAVPVIRGIELTQDRHRHYAKSHDISFSDRVASMGQEQALIIAALEALKHMIYIPALQDTIDDFSQGFSTTGIRSSQLQTVLLPTTERLNREIGSLTDTSNHQITSTEIVTNVINTKTPITLIALLVVCSVIGFNFYLLIGSHKHPYSLTFEQGMQARYQYQSFKHSLTRMTGNIQMLEAFIVGLMVFKLSSIPLKKARMIS